MSPRALQNNPAKQPNRSVKRMAETVGANRNEILRQPQIGNRAMGRLLGRLPVRPQLEVLSPSEREADRANDTMSARTPDAEAPATTEVHAPALRAPQAEFYVSTREDAYEQEANRVAEHVMRMSAPRLQRADSGGGHHSSGSSPPAPATRLQSHGVHASDPALIAPPIVDDVLRSSGQPLDPATRAFMEPRFGNDFSHVRIHTGPQADDAAASVEARAFTLGRDVVFAAGEHNLGSESGKQLLAHELTHVVQQSGTNGSQAGRTPDQQPVVMREGGPLVVRRLKGKVLQKIVGWVVKVGERKLITTTAIYSENELTALLAKGSNVLVKRGKSTAKRIAKKVWGDNIVQHTGHYIKKAGKLGLSHFQPAKKLPIKAGEKGWHIFYTAIPIVFFADDVEAMEVYDDKYPGQSIANYLTVTKYVGEDSWLSKLDWINPLELIAVGGDIGRDLDRERTKELKALVFSRVTADGTTQTYELDPTGQLVRVILVRPGGKQKEMTAEEYYTFLGKKSEEQLPELGAQDGTKHPFYASTFDAEYRIYVSSQNAVWDTKTLSLYLPAKDVGKLKKIGEFYVLEDFSIDHVYAYAHPTERRQLKAPGFMVPEDMISEYAASGDKDVFLETMLESALHSRQMRDVDLWQAK